MIQSLLKLGAIATIFASLPAFSQVSMKGADGPAADPYIKEGFLLDIGAVLKSNIDEDSLSCDDSLADVANQIMSASANKKLLKVANKKDAKALFKSFGLSGTPKSIFAAAALVAAENLCSDEGDDPGDSDDIDDEPEFE